MTKKALLAEQFTDLQSAVNSLGEANIQVDSNLDLSDRSAIRFNAFYEKLQNHRDFFEGERIGINPTAKFHLRPETVLDLSYEYVDHQRFIDRGIPTADNGRGRGATGCGLCGSRTESERLARTPVPGSTSA